MTTPKPLATPFSATAAGRWAILGYGMLSYLVFFATFLYAIGFIGNFAVPTRLDGAPSLPLGTALLIDAALLGLFAVQHSVMARPAFKRWWTRIVPTPAERSTYVLLSSLLLLALFAFWEPVGGIIWHLEDPLAQGTLYGGFAFGWALVLASTFLTSHSDLFGLRQVWLHFRGVPYTPLRFVTPWPYRVVRHPLYVGWLFVFWCTPYMTASHLLFALATTAYIVVGAGLEERDLVREHGDAYRSYRKRVPMLVPGMRLPAWATKRASATLPR
ncbi:MAG: isoprenylcysteine carboxylmethyltransferase family protein [Pseudomonadales bacterium]